MNFMTIEGRDVQLENISTVETRRCGISDNNQYDVIITMNSGQLIKAFRGTKSACDDFKVAFKANVRGESNPYPTVNWADFTPNTVIVEKGKIATVEVLWNGEEAESAAFTYEVTDGAVAEFALGEVLGCEVGETPIATNKDGKKGIGRARVINSKDGVMFEFLGTSLAVGGAVMIPVKNADGINIPFASLSLHSSNPSVATVSANGTIEAVGIGSAMIIADYKGSRYGTAIAVGAAVLKTMSVEEEATPIPKKRTRKKSVE